MSIPPVFDSVAHVDSHVVIRDSCNCNTRCCMPWWRAREPTQLPALTCEEINAIALKAFKKAIRLDIVDDYEPTRMRHS